MMEIIMKENVNLRENERNVLVFDMDGTLYTLNGPNNGFADSSLERQILTNAQAFIQEKEACGEQEASVILQQAISDSVGISRFLSERYGIQRTDYFRRAWDIDPEGIVVNFEIPAQVIPAIKESDPEIKLVLLTAAPRVWAERVLSFIGVRECFEEIYTGEQYGSKDEIFALLAEMYRPERITSIGDQLATDIEPAAKLGMNTVYVRQPSDMEVLR